MNDKTELRATTKVECKQCAEKINVKAIKCVNCGGYQNFRRHFEFSNTALALLIALLSILTVFSERIPNIVKLLQKNNHDLGVAVRIVKADMQELVLIFHNQGEDVVWVPDGGLCHTVSIDDPDKLMQTADGNIIRPALESEVTAWFVVNYGVANDTGGFFILPNKTAKYAFPSTGILSNLGYRKSDSVSPVKKGCFVSLFTTDGREGFSVPIVSDIYQHALIEGVSNIDEKLFPKIADGYWKRATFSK